MKIFFICANSADHDEMPHYAAFHLGLHYLPKYLFTVIQNEKGLKVYNHMKCTRYESCVFLHRFHIIYISICMLF